METFGQKVRQAVQSRGLPLERVAEATGLRIEQIRALAQDDFGGLPAAEALREGLRLFAQLVEVDPEEVIADYRRERERWLAAAPAEAEVELELEVEAEVAGVRHGRDEAGGIESSHRPGEPQAVHGSSKPEAGRKRGVLLLASAILVLAAGAFVFLSRSSTTPGPGRAASGPVTTPPAQAASQARESTVAPAGGEAVPPIDPPSRPLEATRPAAASGKPIGTFELSIPRHGVGRGVVDHELEGETSRFSVGERAWFWTLVEGGSAGESIEHVWFLDGEQVRRVALRVGSARWRTHSYKDLNPGSEGDWAVEARDGAGRVLARREFHCSARR